MYILLNRGDLFSGNQHVYEIMQIYAINIPANGRIHYEIPATSPLPLQGMANNTFFNSNGVKNIFLEAKDLHMRPGLGIMMCKPAGMGCPKTFNILTWGTGKTVVHRPHLILYIYCIRELARAYGFLDMRVNLGRM